MELDRNLAERVLERNLRMETEALERDRGTAIIPNSEVQNLKAIYCRDNEYSCDN